MDRAEVSWRPNRLCAFRDPKTKMIDRIIVRPYQESIDYQGQWCPVCEFWKGCDRFTDERVQ